MDLPTCPACGQSVLDDDVEDCPFCGSSMTGKPTATQPTSAPQTEAAASQPAAMTEPVAKPKTAGARPKSPKSQTANDDPFAVESTASVKAIRSSPKRVKGRTYSVVCPMCETIGYIPRKAAGKDVRCANPECLVPVFTAPEIKKEEPVEEETPREPMSAMQKFMIVSGVIVVIAMTGIWYFVLRDDGSAAPSPPDQPDRNVTNTTNNNNSPDNDTGTETHPDPQPVVKRPEIPKLSVAEMQKRAFGLMVESSLKRSGNRSKAFCRLLTCDAYVAVGNVTAAREQLERLKDVGRDVPFYQALPLVQIAWLELDKNNTKAANKALDDVWLIAQRLPQFGRFRFDVAAELAAALIAVGRNADALSLISDIHSSDLVGHLSAHLRSVLASESFDLDAETLSAGLPAWKNPQSVAVTRILSAKGRWDQALQWAESQGDIEERTDCLVAWAGDFSTNRQPNALTRITSVAKKLSPAGRVRLLAYVAGRQFVVGNKDDAEKLLNVARTAMKSIPVPQPLILPGRKELYSLPLPAEPQKLKMAMQAAAEIARTEILAGRTTEAWNSLALALRFPRAMGPSPKAAQARFDEIEDLGSVVLRGQLKTLLNLENDDQARLALNQYRKQCRAFLEAANHRFQLQVSLLSAAAHWNLDEQIWKEISGRAEESNSDLFEPYYETALPWMLAGNFRASGNQEQAETIVGALRTADQKIDPRAESLQFARQLISEGKYREAAQQFEKPDIDKNWRTLRVLENVCRIVKSNGFESAYNFAIAFENPLLREDALSIAAALAARIGQHQQVWKRLDEAKLPPTETVALAHGLLRGLSAAKSESQPVSEATDEKQ